MCVEVTNMDRHGIILLQLEVLQLVSVWSPQNRKAHSKLLLMCTATQIKQCGYILYTERW